jgi:serine/threonine protein kinase
VIGADRGGWQSLRDWLIRFAGASAPTLVELVEVGPDAASGGAYVASQPYVGGTLDAPAAEMDADQRMAAVAAAARATHALHQVGMAHGALSCWSVLLAEGGSVLDFPPLDAAPGAVTRVSGWAHLATIDPELLAGEVPGRSSDIWSIGATLHTALSDRPLYPGIEHDELVTAVQRLLFTRPEVDPSLPAAVAEIIHGCLEVDPTDRPATALAVAEQIEVVVAGRPDGGPS